MAVLYSPMPYSPMMVAPFTHALSQPPPSPAFSDCSLSSEDIDFCFEVNMPKSETEDNPQDIPQEGAATSDQESEEESVFTEEEIDRVSARFSRLMSQARATDDRTGDIALVLGAAQFPKEMIALTYNIVADMRCFRKVTLMKRHDSAGPDVLDIMTKPRAKAPRFKHELLVLAALHTAFSYFTDGPTKLTFWTETIAQGYFTVQELESARVFVLAEVEWLLYPLALPGAIDSTMALLERPAMPAPKVDAYVPWSCNKTQIQISEQTALEYGLTTPNPSPPCTAYASIAIQMRPRLV